MKTFARYFGLLVPLLIATAPTSVSAQSAEALHHRDTVVLPAHGLGDTLPRDRGGGWGAVAVSRPFENFGIAMEHSTERSAKREALRICRARGIAKCYSEFTFRNTCLSLASGGGHWGSAARPGRQEADDIALQNCRKYGGGDQCRLVEQTCR